VSRANDDAIDHPAIMPDDVGSLLPRRYRNTGCHKPLADREVSVVDLRNEIGIEIPAPPSAVGAIGCDVLVEPLEHLRIHGNPDPRAHALYGLAAGGSHEIDEVYLDNPLRAGVGNGSMDPQHALFPLIQSDEHIVGTKGLMNKGSGHVTAVAIDDDHS
jgi:hypothetical protein